MTTAREKLELQTGRLKERIDQLRAFPVDQVTEMHPGDLVVLEKDIARTLEKIFGHSTNDHGRYIAAADLTYNGSIVMGRRVAPHQIQAVIRSNIESAVKILESAIKALEEDFAERRLEELSGAPPKPAAELHSKDVFIVHGHDHTILQSVARTVEKLGLNPIILHEQPNQSRTIIEKLEHHSDVGFAVVLLTADDVGGAKESQLQPRARQNVVAELFYFIGKLGRPRVCALRADGVEIPSDFLGVTYHPLDAGGAWKFQLGKELKAAGYDVDLNKIL